MNVWIRQAYYHNTSWRTVKNKHKVSNEIWQRFLSSSHGIWLAKQLGSGMDNGLVYFVLQLQNHIFQQRFLLRSMSERRLASLWVWHEPVKTSLTFPNHRRNLFLRSFSRQRHKAIWRHYGKQFCPHLIEFSTKTKYIKWMYKNPQRQLLFQQRRRQMQHMSRAN